MDWRQEASCLGLDTDRFFIEGLGSGNSREVKDLKQMCNSCPVKDACLSEALENERHTHKSDRFGIWGGLSPRQRHVLWMKIKPDNKTECRRGHALTEENTYVSPDGYQCCRTCRRGYKKAS